MSFKSSILAIGFLVVLSTVSTDLYSYEDYDNKNYAANNAVSSTKEIDISEEALYFHSLCNEVEKDSESCQLVPLLSGDEKSVSVLKAAKLKVTKKYISKVTFDDGEDLNLSVRLGKLSGNSYINLKKDNPNEAFAVLTKGAALTVLGEGAELVDNIIAVPNIYGDKNEILNKLAWLKLRASQTTVTEAKQLRTGIVGYLLFGTTSLFTLLFFLFWKKTAAKE
ncbi:MAG: hypothetical protein AB8E15_05430 [Bdellovibrionales bacterium]